MSDIGCGVECQLQRSCMHFSQYQACHACRSRSAPEARWKQMRARVARRTHGVSLEHRVGGCVRYYCRGSERTVVEMLQIAASAGDRVDRQLRLARLVVVQLARLFTPRGVARLPLLVPVMLRPASSSCCSRTPTLTTVEQFHCSPARPLTRTWRDARPRSPPPSSSTLDLDPRPPARPPQTPTLPRAPSGVSLPCAHSNRPVSPPQRPTTPTATVLMQR